MFLQRVGDAVHVMPVAEVCVSSARAKENAPRVFYTLSWLSQADGCGHTGIRSCVSLLSGDRGHHYCACVSCTSAQPGIAKEQNIFVLNVPGAELRL